MIEQSDIARFWSFVPEQPAGECWPWAGKIAWNGYGKYNARGERYTASRIALEIALGRDLAPEELASEAARIAEMIENGFTSGEVVTEHSDGGWWSIEDTEEADEECEALDGSVEA